MIKTVYKEALSVLAKKPIRLWGISLLSALLGGVFGALFGIIPGVALAISLLLETGMTMVFLHGFRGEQVYAVHLFDCFRDWGTIKRVLCGMGWMMLWLFLWSLIPIVGWIFAIIRAYAWRLTPYILVQEPDIAPTQAIKVSAQRTRGFKGKMFWADVLPFVALCVVSIVLTLLGLIPYIGVLFKIILVIVAIIFMLFVGLFLGLVQAGFYEEINAANAAAQAQLEAAARAQEEAAAAYAASHRICPNCGAEVATGAFCSNCGAKME